MTSLNPQKSRCGFNKKTMLFITLYLKRVRINKKENIFIIDGERGSGKSVFAFRFAWELDPTFNLDKVVFNFQAFKEAVFKSKPGDSIVIDEAIALAFNKRALSREVVEFEELMNQIRSKHLNLFFCIPKVTRLTKDIVEDAQTYIRITCSKRMINGRAVEIKGRYKAYLDNPKKGKYSKTLLLSWIRKTREQPWAAGKCPIRVPTFNGPGEPCGETFKVPTLPFTLEEYEKKKKEQIFTKYTDDPEKKKSFLDEKRTNALKKLCVNLKNGGVPTEKIAKMCGLDSDTVRSYIKGNEINLKDTISPVIPNL